MFSSIRWRITIPYAVIILLTTFGLTLYISNQAREARLADLEAHLLAKARLLSDNAAEYLQSPLSANVVVLTAQARKWSGLSGERTTIIALDGTVLGDSDADPENMDNHLRRSEIAQAIREGEGAATRFSRTVGTDLLYVTVLARNDAGEPLGVVRIAQSLDAIEKNVGQLSRAIVAAGLLTALVSIVLATYIASRTVKPVRQLTGAVERMAQGDMTSRLLPTTRDEVGQLMRAFNHMADQLREKMEALAQGESRLSGVLNTMTGGVVITDDTGQILMINPAAVQILAYTGEDAANMSFAQVARDHQLIELWYACRQSGEEQMQTVEIGPENRFLQATATPLHGGDPQRFLVMLQDLTRVRQLETIRRDFISNVSHELRTPLASLSLVVETLQDGAIDDPEAARRFLTYIETELSALTQMVEELLELSRIESGRVPLELKPVSVNKLIKKPVKRLNPQAERANVTVTVELPDDKVLVLADTRRMQQVVMNILHNAIKFTPEGGSVTIKAEEINQEMVISITDTGIGIPEEQISRIFERFYKTDPARSEEGTGLGLSIAKHLVQGHGGRIWLESAEGVGCTFYFTLPLASNT